MKSRRISALMTSYLAVVRLDIHISEKRIDVKPLETSRGVYFGMTKYSGWTLLAARNRDVLGRTHKENVSDSIYIFDQNSGMNDIFIRHPLIFDVHQIRRIDTWLCVVSGRGSQLLVFSLLSKTLIQTIDLSSFVPIDLRRADREEDPYHFNSLFINRNRMMILAHNWDRPSFALDFNFKMGGSGLKDVELSFVHRDLGRASHDIVLNSGVLHVLDGDGGKLILRGAIEAEHRIGLGVDRPFPRGLSITQDYILIGYGFWSQEASARANLGYILARLELKGFISRVGNPHDKRTKSVRLTKKGADLLSVIAPSVAKAQQRILAPLSAQQRRKFIMLLAKIVGLKDHFDVSADLS